MKIGIIVDKIDAFHQQAIQAIGEISPSYGHTVTVYIRDFSGYTLPGIPSVREYHEPDYFKALAHELDALISFSIRDWDYATGYAAPITMVTILDDTKEVNKLDGAVSCILLDHRLALAKAIEHTCNGSTEKRVIGYVTAASMPSRTLQAPQETHPVRIDQPRSKRVSNRTGIKIRNFECPFHPWTLTKSHCRSLSAIICSNDEVAERVGKRVKMEWGFVDIPVISARQSWQKDDGELSNSHAGTRIEFSMEELAYQAVLACEMPQPSQPQIIHIEPHLVEEGHPRD